MSRLRRWLGWETVPSAPVIEVTPGEFRIERTVTRDRSGPYEGEHSQRIEVTDGCFTRTFHETEHGNSEGWTSTGVDRLEIDGDHLAVRWAEDQREERLPLPAPEWLAEQTALLWPEFRWQLLDGGVSQLVGLPIHSLDLRFSRVGARGLEGLQGMPALHTLLLEDLADGAMVLVSKVSTIRRLELPYRVTDADLAELGVLQSLEVLVVGPPQAPWARCEVTDAVVATVAKLESLRTLDLSGCKGLTDAGRASLRGLGIEDLKLP